VKPDSLFIIVEGVLSIKVVEENNDEIEVARRRAGDVIGEMAILKGDPRTATVISITEAQLLEICIWIVFIRFFLCSKAGRTSIF